MIQYKGLLAEFLENCRIHRVEAIYNYEYRYIKEIIYDDEFNEKFGSTREGYENWKKEKTPGGISFSGEVSLRTVTDKDKIIGYVSESKRRENTSYMEMKKQFEEAYSKMCEIINVKDKSSFDYWFESSGYKHNITEANKFILAIEKLEELIFIYDNNSKFKKLIDKIKE